MQVDLYELFAGSTPLVLFVCLGLGYVLGKVQWGPVQLGAGGGVLLTSVLFGHFGYEAPGLIGTLGFIMFIYSVGFQAGPRFFSVFLADGSKYVSLAVMVSATGFALASVLAGVAGLDSGTAAGILAGALTSTPTLIGAQSAVEAGTAALPEGMSRATALQAISVGYAITYLFGTVGLILAIQFMPQVLGLDLVRDASRFARERGYAADEATPPVSQPVIRAYDVTAEEVTGVSLRTLRRDLEANEVVLRIKRGEELFEGTPDFELALGDRIALLAPPQRHQEIRNRFDLQGEVLDSDLLDMRVDVDEVIVSRPEMAGSTLGEIDFTRSWGCFLSKMRRSQIELPIDDHTVLNKGDILTLVGERRMLDRLIERIGYAEDKVQQFDLVTFAFGIVLGLVLGEIQLKMGQVNLSLGTAGGLLVSGILMGFLRSMHPTFGHMPPAARYVFMELGLMFFLVSVGLRAGGGIFEALQTAGLTIVTLGVVLTLAPVILGYLFGRYVLKLNSAILLGAITGAMTSTPALGVVQEAARSSVPALGYAGTYAFSNILLTLAGTAMVML